MNSMSSGLSLQGEGHRHEGQGQQNYELDIV